jgi:hypothetical protein
MEVQHDRILAARRPFRQAAVRRVQRYHVGRRGAALSNDERSNNMAAQRIGAEQAHADVASGKALLVCAYDGDDKFRQHHLHEAI